MEQNNQSIGSGKARTVRSKEQVLAILEEFEKSGFTAKEYCAVSDLNETTFYSWLRKYRQRSEEEIKGFATVEVLAAVTPAKPVLFTEVSAIRLYKEVSAEYVKSLCVTKLLTFREGAKYYLYRRPVKMSRSFDGLAELIRTELDKDLVSGDVFIFPNRTRNMLKVLIYEQKGFSIFNRRLDEGSFQLSLISSDNIRYRMSSDQMAYTLSGMTLEEGGYVKAGKYEPLLSSQM